MNEREAPTGIAILCDSRANVERIIQDGLGISGWLEQGQPFTSILDRGSLAKGLNFLVDLRREGAAFDWELNIRVGGQTLPLHFVGLITDSGMWVVGAETRNGVFRLYEELMRINNEQANALRAAFKDKLQQSPDIPEHNNSLYDDISHLNNELVTLQRELAKKNFQLEALNRQKDQFLGMAAHDLRSPLGVIMSYSEFLIDEAAEALDPEQNEFLSIIRSSSQFMLQLVDDLLDVAKIESGRLDLDLHPTNLADLVKQNVALNQVLAAKKPVLLSVNLDPTIAAMPLDAPKIEQVLNNLISNAVKYSQPNSQVSVVVSQAHGQVIVAVKDEGQGIPPEEMEKLFKPFQTTTVKSTAGEKSTGLGLMIAKKIVEGHGGEIWVESEVSHGSIFYFSLPTADQIVDLEQPQPSTSESSRHVDLAALRVLVADDLELNRRIGRRILEDHGCHVFEASNGQEVLSALENESFDLILMDVHMPGIDGLETTRIIRQNRVNQEQPLIFATTASAAQADREDCLEAGMDDFIGKPIQLADLLAALQRHSDHL